MSALQKGEGERRWGGGGKGGKGKKPHMTEGLMNVNGLAERV